MQKIILDTNILLQEKVDVVTELKRICDFSFELYILDKTLEELEKKKGEKFAIELLSKKDIKVISTKKDKIVDDLIIEIIEEEKYIVVTQDKELKERLIQKQVQVITIRQQKTLAFVNNHVL